MTRTPQNGLGEKPGVGATTAFVNVVVLVIHLNFTVDFLRLHREEKRVQ